MANFGITFYVGSFQLSGLMQATDMATATNTVWADVTGAGAVLDLTPYEIGNSVAGFIRKAAINGILLYPQPTGGT